MDIKPLTGVAYRYTFTHLATRNNSTVGRSGNQSRQQSLNAQLCRYKMGERHTLLVGFGLALFSLTIARGLALADDGHCDPGLEPRAGHPLSYGPRDGRCEGVYVQNVSVPVLRLVSFTKDAVHPSQMAGEPTLIAWTLTEEAPLRIRAQSLRPRLYYRMDTVQSTDTRVFTWPTDIVQALDLAADELGVLAWVQSDEWSVAARVYTPISFDPPTIDAETSSGQPVLNLHIGMFIGRELEEVFVRVLKQVDGAEAFEIFQPRRLLGLGYYPAGRTIAISLPTPEDPGRYLVQFGAQQIAGGAATLEFMFQWAG